MDNLITAYSDIKSEWEATTKKILSKEIENLGMAIEHAQANLDGISSSKDMVYGQLHARDLATNFTKVLEYFDKFFQNEFLDALPPRYEKLEDPKSDDILSFFNYLFAAAIATPCRAPLQVNEVLKKLNTVTQGAVSQPRKILKAVYDVAKNINKIFADLTIKVLDGFMDKDPKIEDTIWLRTLPAWRKDLETAANEAYV